MSRFEIGHEVQSRRDANKIGTVVVIGVLHARVQYYQVNYQVVTSLLAGDFPSHQIPKVPG